MYGPVKDATRCFYTYTLIDPRTEQVFYVGKGSLRYGRTGRLRDHIAKARSGARGLRYNIIRELLALDVKPTLQIVLEEVEESAAYAEERRLVVAYGLTQLSNALAGGGGGPCGVQTGAAHWTQRHPELVPSGDKHPLRKSPNRAARGEDHGRHTHPERTARGARHGCSKLSEQQVDELRRLYVESRLPGQTPITGKALAKQFGVSGTQVGRILRGGWGRPNLMERHGNAKLTKTQVASIPTRLASGATQLELAREWGVSPTAINNYAADSILAV